MRRSRRRRCRLANWEPDWALGQDLVDFRNEERKPHHEISPREREDMQERDRRDFDPEPDEPVWYEVRIIDDEG